MLNYNHLYYFHVVATEGSLAAAAERLGVKQPTVSEQLRALESSLAVRLLDRSPSGVRLTAAGRAAFEQTSVMFRAGERLVMSLHAGAATDNALRIGLSSVLSHVTSTRFLIPLLDLEATNASITIGDAPDIVRELRHGSLDLVLTESEPSALSGLETTLIETLSLVAVASASTSFDSTWASTRLVQYTAASALHWEVDSFLQHQGFAPRVVAEVDDPQFMIEAASRPEHVAFVPRALARDAIAAGQLRIVADLETVDAGVYASYPETTKIELARKAVGILIAHAGRDRSV